MFTLSTALAALAALAHGVAAQETGLDTPIPLTRGAFLATADGPATAHRLPAALGFHLEKRTFTAVEFVGDRLAGGMGLVTRKRFAFAYRHFDNRGTPDFDEDEYSLYFGGGDGMRAAGSEIRWMRNSLGGTPDALSLGFSIGYRPDPVISFAYRGEHMNRPHYLEGRLDDTHTVSVALNPHRTFSLGTDVIFREDGGDDFRIRYGLELRPYRGLELSAVVDNERGFAGGISYGMGSEEAGYGITGSFDGGARRQAAYVGHEDQERRPGPPKGTHPATIPHGHP